MQMNRRPDLKSKIMKRAAYSCLYGPLKLSTAQASNFWPLRSAVRSVHARRHVSYSLNSSNGVI